MELKGKNVLITGGLGFIGSNLACKCLELGAEVTIYDNLDPRSGGNMYNVHDIQDDVHIVLNDIRSFEGISACIRGQDILFSCASYTSHPNSMKEPLIDIDVNCKGMINVLESARRFNPSVKIVHVGTSTQVGRAIFNPIDETHPEFPVDIYSANKLVSEKYTLIYGNAYNLKTAVIRLANVYGPRSNIKSPDFGFINYFIGVAMGGGELTVFGKGSQLRNISYVEDCVDALILASKSDQVNGQVVFAVSNEQYSVLEIAQSITDVMGGRVCFVEWPRNREVIDVGDAIISNAKIRNILDWRPQNELKTGLMRTREYFQSCLEHYL